MRQLIVVLLILLAYTCNACAQTDEVQLSSNKKEYIPGEPILLRTTAWNMHGTNFSGELDSGGRQGWYCLGGAFSLHVSSDDNGFKDITDVDRPSFLVATPPLHVEYWTDRRCMPGRLEIGKSSTRVDMLVLGRPGVFHVRAVFKNKDKSIRITSNVVELRVVPLAQSQEKYAGLAGDDLFVDLGRTIYSAYCEDGTLSLKDNPKIQELASQLVKGHPESSFAECIAASRILAYTPGRREPVLLTDEEKTAAEAFLVEHPKSWLQAGLYRKLFWTYVSQRDKSNTERIIAQAARTTPDDAVLNEVRQAGPAMLSRIIAGTPTQASEPTSTATLMIILVVVFIVVLCVVIIWHIKKRHIGSGTGEA